MFRAKLFIVCLLGVAILSAGCNPADPPPAVTPSLIVPIASPYPTPKPSHDAQIHLSWFYKPPENVAIDNLPAYFDTFILTHKDEGARDQLLSLGVKKPILE